MKSGGEGFEPSSDPEAPKTVFEICSQFRDQKPATPGPVGRH
jgi:hypothetical protein